MNQMDLTKKSIKTTLAALETETMEVVQASKRLNENLVEAVRRTWWQLLFIWVIVAALAVSFFLILSRAPSDLKVAEKPAAVQNAPAVSERAVASPAAPPPVDTFPAIPEKDDLLKVLNQIREAQYKKDIDLFLGAYAPTFPELSRKKEFTLNVWRRYDYLDLQFRASDLRHQDAVTIVGTITWDIKARDRKTDTVKTLSKSYQVQFSKASGQWLVQQLDGLDDKES